MHARGLRPGSALVQHRSLAFVPAGKAHLMADRDMVIEKPRRLNGFVADFSSPRINLLDGFELRVGARAVDVPRSCQRLVALLALWDRPVERALVSGTLWPDSDTEHANASLRSALWRLPGGGSPIVVANRGQVMLDAGVSVDYREAVWWSRQVITGDADLVSSAWSIGEAGEVLPGWYDEWVLAARERFRQMRLHALEALCEQLAGIGRFAEALAAGLSAVALEPLRETAHRQVIAVHLQEGNHVEALRQYRSFERLLDDELGLEPSATLTSMVCGAAASAAG